MARKLRIAFSVACGIACLLLVVLWGLSYRYLYMLEMQTSTQLLWIHAQIGRLEFKQIAPLRAGSPRFQDIQTTLANARRTVEVMSKGRTISSRPIGGMPRRPYKHGKKFWGFAWHSTAMTRTVVVPFWSLVLLFGAFSAALWLPWTRWHFSLRTLLIATTLVAVGLGLIVWAAR